MSTINTDVNSLSRLLCASISQCICSHEDYIYRCSSRSLFEEGVYGVNANVMTRARDSAVWIHPIGIKRRSCIASDTAKIVGLTQTVECNHTLSTCAKER